ncbi:MAG: tRNA (adenosine(37)-N6)-threonylcarbamoyltransferase complex dimerization subunit type 1 TsaB [bacterium]|nr:tRNA (adenosine(37)-N6)-threonylcarbamoyltransferase complex dimerization subunit type 1 TsaB [bacterium]
MTTLSIDTSGREFVFVSLGIDGKMHTLKEKMDKKKAQAVLPLVDTLLQKHKLTMKDIQEIQVNVGPGSFTGLRVGVAITNTLGFLLTIPVNGMPVGTFVQPVYS